VRGVFVLATFSFFSAFRLAGYLHDPLLPSTAIHEIIGEPDRIQSSPRHELKVVTWNIEYGSRFARVLDTARTLDADVYILQEVDLFCRRSGNRNIAKDLADALGINWIFAGEFQEIGESPGRVGALTGQAILSRYPISDASAIVSRAQAWARWHLNPVQPRRGDRTVLVARTAGLRIYNAHLESGENERLRRKQLDDILADSAGGSASSPVLLAGDFNNNPIRRTKMVAAITAANFIDALGPDAASRKTCDHHEHPIDWLFVKHARPLSGGVLAVDHVSDHYPVTATLQLEP
jgi:endonuclease/exonuclease/phosphatase family metal-dependent hydrolase